MGKRQTRRLREILGKNIRLERIRQDLTQEQLAERADSDQTFISAVERATKSASVDMIERLAKALRVRPGELLDERLGRS